MDGGLSEEAFAIEPGRVCFSLVLPSGTVWHSQVEQLGTSKIEKVLVYAKAPLHPPPTVQLYLWDICMFSHNISAFVQMFYYILLSKVGGNTVLSNSERTLSF